MKRNVLALTGLPLVALAALATIALFAPSADAWQRDHHEEMSVDYIRWSPLGDRLDTVYPGWESHLRVAANSIDDTFPASHCPTTSGFNGPYYASTDDHGIAIAGGGVCKGGATNSNFPHTSLPHSDLYNAEGHFQASYSAAQSAWNSGDYHTAVHKLGHMLHYLQDLGNVVHTCDLEWPDIMDCMDAGLHEDHEWYADYWHDNDFTYNNKRLSMSGKLGSSNTLPGMEYAFRNFPVTLESGDGKSDLAEVASFLSHAQGWDAKDNLDLPDDGGCDEWNDPDKPCRQSVGEDWWENLAWTCPACSSNRDIFFTGIWETSRVAGGTLKLFAQDVGLPTTAYYGNDMIELTYTMLRETANTDPFSGNPDLYAHFYIELGGGTGYYEYRGITAEPEGDNNKHTIFDYAIASNVADHSGSGNWLPPVAKTGNTLGVRTDLWDDDPSGGNDPLGSYYQTWSAGTYGEKCISLGTRTVCVEAVDLGDVYDTRAPATSASFGGTLGSGGWYTSGGWVTLSAADTYLGVEQSGVAATYYRIGSGAWNSGTSFFFGTQGTTTISYYSVDDYGNTESVKTLTIRIDSVDPSTSASTSCSTWGSSGWCRSSSATVTVSCSDAASGCSNVYRRVDGGSWLTYTGPFSVFGDGTHSVCTYARDVAGNQESSHCITVRIDSTVPDTDATLSGTLGGSGWYLGSVGVTLSCTDSTSGCSTRFYRIDGGAWQVYTGTFFVSGDGSHTVQHYARDVAGNQEGAESRTVKIDLGSPTTSASLSGTSGGGGWYRSAVTVTIACSDTASGCDDVYRRINTSPWQSYTGSFLVSDGTFTVQHYGVDFAGRTSSTGSVSFKSDTQAPTVSTSHTCPSTGGWCTGTATVTGSASDSLSGLSSLEYRIGFGAWTTYSGPFTVSGEGVHTVSFRGTDVAGNTRTVTETVRIDLSVPNVSIVRPDGSSSYTADVAVVATGGLIVGPVTVEATAADALSGVDRVEFYVDGTFCGTDTTASAGRYTYTWDTCGLVVSDTAYVLSAVAYDEAGHSATATKSVTRAA